MNQGARKFNYATRFWSILFDNLRQDEEGAAILKEMDSEAKKIGRSSRYVWVKYAEKLYSKVNPQTFRTAQKEICEHVSELMEKAFLSKGRAKYYQLKFI